jgi:hypothetical protein
MCNWSWRKPPRIFGPTASIPPYQPRSCASRDYHPTGALSPPRTRRGCRAPDRARTAGHSQCARFRHARLGLVLQARDRGKRWRGSALLRAGTGDGSRVGRRSGRHRDGVDRKCHQTVDEITREDVERAELLLEALECDSQSRQRDIRLWHAPRALHGSPPQVADRARKGYRARP